MKIKWSKQNPNLNTLIRLTVNDMETFIARSFFDEMVACSVSNGGAPNTASISYMNVSADRLIHIINHSKELPKLEDGVQLNDNLWVRIQFMDWEAGTVYNYTLFANGLSPHQELLNEAIGSELCCSPIDCLPKCIATPLLMRRVRGRDTETIRMPNSRTVWMNDLRVTVEDVLSITGRDKWEYQPQGENVCKELINLLRQQEPIRVSV